MIWFGIGLGIAIGGPLLLRHPGQAGGMVLAPAPLICPAEALARYDAGSARMRRFAASMFQDSADQRFGVARLRVPGFSDWAYDWVQSYLTSYRILAQALRGAGEAAVTPGRLPTVDEFAHRLAGPIREQFDEQVTGPAMEGGGLAADLAHIAAVLEEEHRMLLAELAATIPGARALPPLTPEIIAAVPHDADTLFHPVVDTETVFLRSVRPLASRLGVLAVRVSEAGSIVTTAGVFGYALAGTPGVVVGVAGGIGLSWGLDWIINHVDAAINRDAFEANAMTAIATAEAGFLTSGAAAVDAALAARRAALGALPTAGCV